MQIAPQPYRPAGEPRRSERGAALITTLLISMMLLTAGGALILTTSMSGTNAVSATAEMHAYYAAEAGLQRALDIMRSNVPAPPGTPALADGTTIASFRNVAGTNLGTWLQLPCANVTRCGMVGATPVMRVGTRAAYSIAVSDPDNTPPPRLPKRLRVLVTGYGPNGALKVLDTMIVQSGLWGFSAPSTVTLIGSSNPLDTAQLALGTGSSIRIRYSGEDAARPGDPGYDPARAGDRPVFGTTPPAIDDVTLGIERPTQIEGVPVGALGDGTNGTVPTPEWLASVDNARLFVEQMRGTARPEVDVNGNPVDTPTDRYFTSTMQPPASNVRGITFIEGNADLGPGNQGSGILVVTGKLTMNGGTDFNGLILVMGDGIVERQGTGNGTITGGMVVARFGPTGDFEAPSFITDGGGNSRFQYNSAVINTALSSVPSFTVVGVVEK
ncbi:MAG TPA: pilus assembly PilX N-terminal domain-containing protein [Pyrinomonadaceae bacterium]